MILSSDEQRSLDVIGSDLCADEPRLAAKFGIFTRLAAEEDRPPDEDLVRPVRPPPPPPAPVAARAIPAAVAFRRSRGRHRGLLPRRNRMDFFVLGALLLLVILIFYISRGR
jgi:hypothetical protein